MGKQRRYILLIIISTFIFGACKKEVEPVLQAGKTVFTLKGFIDEQSLEAEAGKNSFYLFTSYDRDSNQNLRCKANLKKTCIPNILNPTTYRNRESLAKIKGLQARLSRKLKQSSRVQDPRTLGGNQDSWIFLKRLTTFPPPKRRCIISDELRVTP